MSKITINGVTVDPLVQGPALAASNLLSADATGSDYIGGEIGSPFFRSGLLFSLFDFTRGFDLTRGLLSSTDLVRSASVAISTRSDL